MKLLDNLPVRDREVFDFLTSMYQSSKGVVSLDSSAFRMVKTHFPNRSYWEVYNHFASLCNRGFLEFDETVRGEDFEECLVGRL